MQDSRTPPSAFEATARPAIDADRSAFIASAYNHLFASILAFVALEVVFFKTGVAEALWSLAMRTSWLLFLGAFMLIGWLVRPMAWKMERLGLQYAALAIFVVAEALLFTVPLYWAQSTMPGAITTAAWISLVGFAALTAVVFVTRKDFSFLRGILFWGGILALVAIVVGVLFGFSLGLWFSVAMVAIAGAGILYDTSKILHGFPADRPVAAALELFASAMLLFWYVLRIVRSGD